MAITYRYIGGSETCIWHYPTDNQATTFKTIGDKFTGPKADEIVADGHLFLPDEEFQKIGLTDDECKKFPNAAFMAKAPAAVQAKWKAAIARHWELRSAKPEPAPAIIPQLTTVPKE